MKLLSVVENPFSSTVHSPEYHIKSIEPIRIALARILWNEPEDMVAIKQRMRMDFTIEVGIGDTAVMTIENIEDELTKLISAGLVGIRYGFYFLTITGRQWAERCKRCDGVQEITG